MTDSAQYLKDAVKAFIEGGSKLSPSGMGRMLFGNPSFVRVLLGGKRTPRLDTADRVLHFMGMELIGPRFRKEVEAYLKVTGAKPSAVGQGAVKNRSFVKRLQEGSSPRLKTVDRMRAWMRKNATAEEWRMIEAAAGEGPGDGEPSGGDAASSAAAEEPSPAAGAKALYWSTRELAPILRRSQSTLCRWRLEGGGPPYLKLRGRVLYARAKVNAWLASRERSSTSDPGKPPPEPETDETPCSPESE